MPVYGQRVPGAGKRTENGRTDAFRARGSSGASLLAISGN
jgi:hypothetical protein